MSLTYEKLLIATEKFKKAGVAGDPRLKQPMQQVIEPPIAIAHKRDEPMPDMRRIKIKYKEIE